MALPKYCDTPEKVEAWKAKQKTYNQTPEAKAYHKARKQTPEYKAYNKAYQKAYYQTPEHKAAAKACNQTPKAKACKKAYKQTLRKEQFTADAFRMMQAASELAKALTNLSKPTPKNK